MYMYATLVWRNAHVSKCGVGPRTHIETFNILSRVDPDLNRPLGGTVLGTLQVHR